MIIDKFQVFTNWVFLLLTVSSVHVSGEICFIDGCVCDPSTASASCRLLTLQAVPAMPDWVENLIMIDNHLTELGDRAFRGSLRLRHITFVNCALEYLHPLTFKGLDKLESLDLSRNHLENLPLSVFAQLPNLKHLNLSHNLLSDFDNLQDLVAHPLESLSFHGNPLRFSSAKTRLPNAKSLDLGALRHAVRFREHGILFDNMSDCLMENCRQLHFAPDYFLSVRHLNLAGCDAMLEANFIKTLTSLKSLDISGNRLDSPDDLKLFDRFDQLKSLNVSGMRVPGLKEWHTYPRRLQKLDLSGMGLLRLPTQSVPTTNDIREIRAENNEISSILLLKRFANLTILSLSGNNLSKLPSIPPGEVIASLETLDLSQNQIGMIGRHAFRPYPALRNLDLSKNQIRVVVNDAFPIVGDRHFEFVDLSSNLIRELNDLVMPQLLSLNLAKNQLGNFHPPQFFESMVSLRELDLAQNDQLFVEVSAKCQNASALLNDFDCYPKWIRYAAELNRIQLLNLSQTALPGLPNELLKSWPTLKHFDLSGNEIHTDILDGWAKSGVIPSCLLSLNLASNELTSSGKYATPILAESACLMLLNMSKNPFVCDCRLHDMKQFLEQHADGTTLLNGIRDETDYFCYSEQNGWQYPLYSFLTAVEPCVEQPSTSGYVSIRVTATLLLLCVVSAFIYVLCCRVFGLNRRTPRNIQYFYKPLSRNSNVTGSTEQLASPTAL